MRKLQLGIKHGFAKFGGRFVALVFQQVDLLGIIAQRYQITENAREAIAIFSAQSAT